MEWGLIGKFTWNQVNFEEMQMIDHKTNTQDYMWYEMSDASKPCSLSSLGMSILLTMGVSWIQCWTLGKILKLMICSALEPALPPVTIDRSPHVLEKIVTPILALMAQSWSEGQLHLLLAQHVAVRLSKSVSSNREDRHGLI